MTIKSLLFFAVLWALALGNHAKAQIVINEGSNRNYAGIADENGEFPDWIELYNAGIDTISLLNYTLTDDAANPSKWLFPNIQMAPDEFKTIFCSGKDRSPVTGFKNVLNTGSYKPVVGWNTHTLNTPFYWDGISSILVNTCSYRSTGYTTNSVFNQTQTAYNASVFAFQDGSPYICTASYGTPVHLRPNMKLNDVSIGSGTTQNTPYDYPAPYGNWYWAAKNQMILPAAELLAAGMTAGDVASLAFDVVSTDSNTVYDYIDIYMKLVSVDEVNAVFDPIDTNNNIHTNFKISRSGETVSLYSPAQVLLSSLFVNCNDLDNSVGSFPDSSANIALFQVSTPAASNNAASTYSGYLQAPVLSVASGFFTAPFTVSISNPNGGSSAVRYTLDGSDPTPASALYIGVPVNVFYSGVVKARAFAMAKLPSPIAVATYLMGVDHVTPVLSVVTDKKNLYGDKGIFDNWQYDWEKAAYVEYFDTTNQLIFSQAAGMQIDGGAGGSRSQPQHSFRIELDDAVLGAGPINYPIIPNRPYRTKFSKFYLRNGSNQYLVYPYKDACELEAVGGGTNNYYSAWRPVTVYINGTYFGLYELREKFDSEYFNEIENANPDSTDILTQSYWYGGVLRPTEGDVVPFFDDCASFNNLDAADTAFWTKADHYFDMQYYNDYIIAESWIGNVDWPGNNIKIYRSDKTDHRWRFCLVDLELSLSPNGWTTCYDDHIKYLLDQSPSNPYINIWLKGMQNPRFKNYFINRFADVMNTAYLFSRTSAIENAMFSQTVLEMQKEYLRWGNPNNIFQQMTDFNNNHLSMQFQFSKRTSQVRNHIQANFAMAGQVDVTLDVVPPGAGKIKISTIIPETLPWTGVYFNGNPVKITVLPKPGFDFLYWDANAVMPAQDTNHSLLLNITADAVFTAVFAPSEFAGKLSISELNFHSDSTRDAGDWVEFHNAGDGPLDLSGYRFTDSIIYHNYYFPAASILPPDGRMVLAEDTTKFHALHPGIPCYGPMGFGLSNSNEAISVYDNANDLVLTMHYDDSIPWQQAADGYGRTLELLHDSLAPGLPSSWFAGCIGGSPGQPYSVCPEPIIFSEINYKSAAATDAGDWVEILNTGPVALDLSGWHFRDDDDTHTYAFPAGTMLPSSAYLVLFADFAKFSTRFPGVANKIGPFGFGLGSGGDAIRLFDQTGRLFQSVVYDDAAPWPAAAAGLGYTLEILDQNGHFCEGINWFAGCPEGSPGVPYSLPCYIGIDELTDVPRISLFPNPSRGIFSLLLQGQDKELSGTRIAIYNFLAEPVFEKILEKHETATEIDISSVPAGIYFVRVFAGKKTFTEKIVIQSGF